MSQPLPLKYQFFNQTIDLVTNNDDHKFYMVDLSDANNIIKCSLTFIPNNQAFSHSVDDLVWDWESDLMNQLVNVPNDKKRKIRASTRYLTMMKNRSCCLGGDYYHFVWNGVQDFFDEKLPCSPVVPYIYEKGAAFVGDGGLLMISECSDTPIYIERGKNSNFTMEVCSELPRIAYNTTECCTDIVIPCSNVLKRDYSLTALYLNSNVFLFDLKNDKFSNTPIQFIHPDNLFVFKEAFNKSAIIPYLEGNRMRVFVVQKERLFELVWSGEEFNSQLQMVSHLQFVQSIHSISRIDNLGLLVRSKDVNRKFQYHIYEPQSYNTEHCQKEGIWRFITNVRECILYAPKSKSIVEKYQTDYIKYLSFEEMMALPSNRIREIFDVESFAKFKEYDASFNVYKPRCESKAIKKVSYRPNQRITEGYQIELKYIDHIEIVAGIKCKDFADKLGQFISKDYVELSPTDLADYLGAPIIYLDCYGGNRLTHQYFLGEMQYGKRTSPMLEMALAGGGGSIVDITNLKFIGIVQGKPFDDSSEMITDEDEETEHEKLFKNNQFILETKTMIATDPFVSDGGVLLQDCKPGVWQWKTTNKIQNYVDDGYLDPTLTAQFVAVHSDYEHLLSDSIWKLPKDRKQEYSGQQHERTEYFEKKLEGGWFQMKLGVSNVPFVGLFDDKYFNDEKALPPSKIRRRAILEEHFELCHYSPYQEYLTKRMENYPSQMDMPFGIITSSGYGGDYFPVFFKKSENGEVIAVKIFFA